MNIDEFRASLCDRDLDGLDSEFTLTTRNLVKNFNASGAHLNRWWALTPVHWICPCCNRSKAEIVRLNKNNFLTCQLHEHHDHMKDIVKSLFEKFSTEREVIVADHISEKFAEKIAFSLAAYDNTIVCFDCNKADSDAKSIVKAHEYFSFSPKEIGEFICAAPNKEHHIDSEAAKIVWERVKPTFETRLDLAKTFAKIAAEKSDWYQPSSRTAKQIERLAHYYFKRNHILEIQEDEPVRLLYNTDPFKGKEDSWRTKHINQTNKAPSKQEIDHLAATRGKYWNHYNDNWICSCCQRTKYQCVRPSKKNSWVLEIKSCSLFDLQTKRVIFHPPAMCNDCMNTAINIGKEVVEKSGVNFKCANGTTLVDVSAVISLTELSHMIKPKNHSVHQYNNAYINDLMPTLIERARHLEYVEILSRNLETQN